MKNLERFIYAEKTRHYSNGKTLNAIGTLANNGSRPLQIFDEYDLNQEEKNMLAVIALNAGLYDLFKAAIEHGAQFINYPEEPRVPEIAPELQQYRLSVFSNKNKMHAYLDAGGPYFDAIPGTEVHTGTASENDKRYFFDLPSELFEKVIRRECLPVDSDKKRNRLSMILKERGPVIFRNCSPEFSKEIMEAYSLPPGTLEVLCESGMTSLENKKAPTFDQMVLGYGDFQEKIKQCLVNDADEDRIIRKESMDFIGFPQANNDGKDDFHFSGKEVNEKNEKEIIFSRCLFLQEELPIEWQLSSKEEHYSLDKTQQYDDFVNNTLPSIYFWLGMLEKNIKQIHQMSPHEQSEITPEHPLFQHTKDIMIQLNNHGKNWSPLVLSHYGILESWVDSPLFHNETIAPLVHWAVNFEDPENIDDKWLGCQPVFDKFIATMVNGLKKKPVYQLEDLLSEHDEELHTSKSILSYMFEHVLSNKLHSSKPAPKPMAQPRF